jgi:hypothetical protein
MTDRPGDAQRVGGAGKWIVALIVLAVVVGVVVWALGRDNSTSTPLEDAAAGRDVSAGVSTEPAGPQGRQAPDSDEAAGSDAQVRETPQANSGVSPSVQPSTTADTGRNAPAGEGRAAQRVPDGSLTEGPDRAPAATAPVRP